MCEREKLIVYFFGVHISADNELVIINFYADWCRFSNVLAPVFDEAADKVAEEFKSSPGRVVLGKVDCDNEGEFSSRDFSCLNVGN